MNVLRMLRRARIEHAETDRGFGLADDERRQQPHDGFRRAIHDQAARERGGHDRPRIGAEIEAPDETLPAHLADDRMAAEQAAKALLEDGADATDVTEQAFVGELIEHVERRPAGQEIAAVGRAVIAELDRLGDRLGREAPRQPARRRRAPCRPRSRSGVSPSDGKWNACPVRPSPDCTSSADEQRAGATARVLDGRRRSPAAAVARRPRPGSARR